MTSLYIAQFASCFFMAGVIWIVQLVHYPAFYFVQASRFNEFHAFHSSRITFIVMPAMSIELLSAGALAWTTNEAFWKLNLVGVVALWAATGLVSVPLHKRLLQDDDSRHETIRKLVVTNWIRVALWSVRAMALIVAMARFA